MYKSVFMVCVISASQPVTMTPPPLFRSFSSDQIHVDTSLRYVLAHTYHHSYFVLFWFSPPTRRQQQHAAAWSFFQSTAWHWSLAIAFRLSLSLSLHLSNNALCFFAVLCKQHGRETWCSPLASGAGLQDPVWWVNKQPLNSLSINRRVTEQQNEMEHKKKESRPPRTPRRPFHSTVQLKLIFLLRRIWN